MIISHANQYVYVELPRTGSTAVAKELGILVPKERAPTTPSLSRKVLSRLLGRASDLLRKWVRTGR